MAYQLQFQKTDTLAAELAAGATSATLTTGSFGSPTGTQLLVVDYDVPAKREVISCTIAGTALTSLVRNLDGAGDVTHAANANVMMAFVPTHYANGLGYIAGGDGWSSWTPTWTNLTIGNATVVAKYRQLGTFVEYHLSVVFGNTTSVSGSVSFSLPVTAANHGGAGGVHPLGVAVILDSGTEQFDAVVKYNTTTTAVVKVKAAGGTYVGANTDLSSTVPMTWTTSDEIQCWGNFVAAAAAGA